MDVVFSGDWLMFLQRRADICSCVDPVRLHVARRPKVRTVDALDSRPPARPAWIDNGIVNTVPFEVRY